MSKQNIILIISFSDTLGGSEAHALKFTKLMNYSFHWIALKTSKNSIKKTIREHPLCLTYCSLNHLNFKNSFNTINLISKIIKQENTVKIYAIGFLPSLFACILKITIPSLLIVTARREMMTWRRWFHYPFIWYIDLMSTHIETNSQYLFNKFQKNLILKSKTYLLQNIITDSLFNQSLKNNPFNKLFNFKTKIGLVANVRPPKNIEMFLNISNEILSQNKNCCFALVGRDTVDKKIENMIKNDELHENFFYFNDINIDEVGSFYKTIDVFLFTSLHEGNPNVISEALAFGLPIVSSKIPATKSLLKHKENALLCDPNDLDGFLSAIKRLISNKELRNNMKISNQRIAKEKLNNAATKNTLKKIFKFSES